MWKGRKEGRRKEKRFQEGKGQEEVKKKRGKGCKKGQKAVK